MCKENEFGAALDGAGYAPSIMQRGASLPGALCYGPAVSGGGAAARLPVAPLSDGTRFAGLPSEGTMEPTRCYLCGRSWGAKMDRHEPWGGIANREKSKALGLWVTLCHFGCHEGPGSVHADAAMARELRKDAQRAAMLRYGWSREEWIRRFGKSELSEDEAARIIPKDATSDEIDTISLSARRGTTPQSAAPTAPLTRGAKGGGGFVVLCDPELPF